MQWNTREFEQWEELRPFVDTALLPLYLFRPDSELSHHVLRMNYLLNVAAGIEQRLKGRVLLFPLAYEFGDQWKSAHITADFAHHVLLCFDRDKAQLTEEDKNALVLAVGDEDLESALRFEVTVDVLYKEVIRHWQRKQGQ